MRMTTAKNLLHNHLPHSISLHIIFAVLVLIPVLKKYDNELSWKIEYYYHEHLKSHLDSLIKPKRNEMTDVCPYCGKTIMQIYDENTKFRSIE